MTLRALEVPIGLQLAGGVRYGDGARSIILNAMLSYRPAKFHDQAVLMPLRPAPALAHEVFHPEVLGGLIGREPAWGAALSGCCPSASPARVEPRCGLARCADKAVQSTSTVAGRSYTSIMDVCVAHWRAEAIRTGHDLRGRKGLVQTYFASARKRDRYHARRRT